VHGLYELLNEADIFKYIKVNRLGWAGHVMRKDSNRSGKKVFNTRPEETRKIGRPKPRWEDGVTQDFKALGLQNWKFFALNGEEWQKFLKVRACTGLSGQ
jgi:hypothetical protein